MTHIFTYGIFGREVKCVQPQKGGDKVDFEYRKLRGRIVEKFETNGKFADYIGVSSVTVSNKLRGITQFSQDDIILWCDVLDIPIAESGAYFFA